MNDDGSVQTIPVHFAGEGDGEAPLTWAQADHWRVILDTGAAPIIGGAFKMPAGSTVEQVVELLRFIMSRHQSLRTRLKLAADGQTYQACSASGVAELTVVEAGAADPAELADQLMQTWSGQPFNYEHDWPVRMAVITSAEVVSHVVTVYLHLAIDAGGIAALMADLAARDPLTGAASGPVTALQPLDLARKQARPSGQRQSAASLRHLEQVLRSIPGKLFGDPRPGPASYQKLRYRSPATDLAIGRIAAEHNVSPASALLAAFAVALARQLRTGTVWTMVLVNNRFRPGCADSVSQLVQGSPCLIELAGLNLLDALALTNAGLLNTYKNAYYDGAQRRELEQRIGRELGEPVELSCCYNDRGDDRPASGAEPASDALLARALTASSWAEEFEHSLPTVPLFLNIDYSADAVELVASFDNRYLELTEAVALAGLIEAAAVELAISPDAAVLQPERIGSPA
ncbi:MAG: condensation domain-containing protein [Jatrophihabitantaceae bacterium]